MISDDIYGILNRLILNQPIVPSPEGILRLLGFVHVYSASGLHLIALESFLGRFFGRNLVTKKILTVSFWFFLILIWKLQGFRLGFARVLVLFFLRSLARVKGYRWRVYYPLFLALCFDFALGIDSGWQHYYLAILGGMLGLEYAKNRNLFIQHLYLSVASWLMTAPLDLFQHHTIAWMTPIWSLVTIPIIALFLYPMSVFSYLLLGTVPSWLMEIWNQGAGLLLRLPDCGFTFSVVGIHHWWFTFFLALFSATFFVLIKSSKNRLFFCIFSLIALLSYRFYPVYHRRGIPIESSDGSRSHLIQFDVGQGDSLAIQKNERVEMIDLGTSREIKPETVLLRLAHHGITHVDTVLFSHLDEDHAGGLRLLLPWVPLEQIEISSRLERTMRVREWLQDFPTVNWCEDSCMRLANIDWVDSRRSFYRKLTSHAAASGNDLMATAIIPISSREVYLALGDSDSKQESIFWSRHREEVLNYPKRFLKVSHHGSKHSSSAEFLRGVSPVRAVISVGKHNHYHHPHFSVVNQLLMDRIPIHRMDRDGDFVLDGG